MSTNSKKKYYPHNRVEFISVINKKYKQYKKEAQLLGIYPILPKEIESVFQLDYATKLYMNNIKSYFQLPDCRKVLLYQIYEINTKEYLIYKFKKYNKRLTQNEYELIIWIKHIEGEVKKYHNNDNLINPLMKLISLWLKVLETSEFGIKFE